MLIYLINVKFKFTRDKRNEEIRETVVVILSEAKHLKKKVGHV